MSVPVRTLRYGDTLILLALLSQLTTQLLIVLWRLHVLRLAARCPTLAVVDVAPPVRVGVFA